MCTIEYSKTGSISIVDTWYRIPISPTIVTNELVNQIPSSEETTWELFYTVGLLIIREECAKNI